MSGKIRIVRVLGNPKKNIARRRRTIIRNPPKSKKQRRRDARREKNKNRYVIRLVTGSGRALWWTGRGFANAKSAAVRFVSKSDASRAMNGRRYGSPKNKAPAGWIVMDALPA